MRVATTRSTMHLTLISVLLNLILLMSISRPVFNYFATAKPVEWLFRLVHHFPRMFIHKLTRLLVLSDLLVLNGAILLPAKLPQVPP
jgi:hypothetical protein